MVNCRREKDMEWLNEVLGMGASAATGGVFGLLGSVFGSVFKYFKAKQDMAFEQLRWAHEDKLLELQMQQRQIETEHELAVVAQSGSWSALKESMQKMTAAGESYKWVNAIKDLFRPFITTLLALIAFLIFKDVMAVFTTENSSLGLVFSPAEAKELLKYIIYSMIFASTTSLVWWFADRAFAPPGMKNR